MDITINEQDFATLAICALRYCQGRQTYMPDLVRRIVRDHIDCISDGNLDVMIEDCKFQRSISLYGDPSIDKPGWVEWEKFLNDLKKNR